MTYYKLLVEVRLPIRIWYLWGYSVTGIVISMTTGTTRPYNTQQYT